MVGRIRRVCSVCLIGTVCMIALYAIAPSDSPVADAAMQGSRDAVRSLLKQGIDVNTAQGDGLTALHWAAMNDDVEMAQMLIYAGANVKATTRLGAYTPLLMASKNGNASMIETLLNAGADAEATAKTGTTPLMLAAAAGNADALLCLLDHGVEVDARESARGQTALMFAAAYDRPTSIQVLMRYAADPKMYTTVVDLAAREEADRRRREQQQKASQGGRGGQGTGGGQAGNPSAELRGTGEEEPRQGQTSAVAVQPAQPPTHTATPSPSAELKGTDDGDPRRDQAEGTATESTPGDSGKQAKDLGEKRNFFSKIFSWMSGGKKSPKEGSGGGAERPRGLSYAQLVGHTGGLTPLLFAARQGHSDAVQALLGADAEVNRVSAGDKTSPLLIAIINGHFDLALLLLDKGADPTLASDSGATPLFAALNVRWAQQALYPQPKAYLQQKATHLDLMKVLLDKGADPNVRLKKKVWYSGYNFDLSGVDETGATPFWRAAYASDVAAMRLLAAHGADPNIPTVKPPQRQRSGAREEVGKTKKKDHSGLPPIPVGGPAVTPLHAAAGAGYGKGFAANSHRYAPNGPMAAAKYLVEQLGADVNAADHEGLTTLHHAASRGDTEMIRYLVSKGADAMAVSRSGQTTADMANGPVQRVQPFPEALALLMELGSKNSNKCLSC